MRSNLPERKLKIKQNPMIKGVNATRINLVTLWRYEYNVTHGTCYPAKNEDR